MSEQDNDPRERFRKIVRSIIEVNRSINHKISGQSGNTGHRFANVVLEVMMLGRRDRYQVIDPPTLGQNMDSRGRFRHGVRRVIELNRSASPKISGQESDKGDSFRKAVGEIMDKPPIHHVFSSPGDRMEDHHYTPPLLNYETSVGRLSERYEALEDSPRPDSQQGIDASVVDQTKDHHYDISHRESGNNEGRLHKNHEALRLSPRLNSTQELLARRPAIPSRVVPAAKEPENSRRRAQRSLSEVQRYEELKTQVRTRERRDHVERQRRLRIQAEEEKNDELRIQAEEEKNDELIQRVIASLRLQNLDLLRKEKRRLEQEERHLEQERERLPMEEQAERRHRLRRDGFELKLQEQIERQRQEGLIRDVDMKANDSEVSSDVASVESLYSIPSLTSGSTLSSVSSQKVLGAAEDLALLLLQDEDLIPLYEMALERMEIKKFERNLTKLLGTFAIDLIKEAGNSLQRSAAHFVKERAKYVTSFIISYYTSSKNEASEQIHNFEMPPTEDMIERYLEQQINISYNTLAIDFSATSETKDVGQSGKESEFDESQPDKRDTSQIQDLDGASDFILDSSAISNLRENLRRFVFGESNRCPYPQTEPSMVDNSDEIARLEDSDLNESMESDEATVIQLNPPPKQAAPAVDRLLRSILPIIKFFAESLELREKPLKPEYRRIRWTCVRRFLSFD